MAAGPMEPVLVGTGDYHFTVADGNVHGYKAMLLAKHGAVAAPTIFEGPGGFYHRFGEVGPDALVGAAEDLERRLGTDWQLQEMVYKPWPVHFFNLVFVDAAIKLGDSVSADAIEKIDLVIPPNAAVAGGLNLGPYLNRDPIPGATGFLVACGLTRGRCGLADVDDFAAPDIMRLVEKTTVSETDDPYGSITVTADGTATTFDIETQGRDFRLPMDDIVGIYRDVIRDVLDPEQAERLLSALQAIDSTDDAGELIPLMVRSPVTAAT
jgi:2-methylcitrate dehydratase PrpD